MSLTVVAAARCLGGWWRRVAGQRPVRGCGAAASGECHLLLLGPITLQSAATRPLARSLASRHTPTWPSLVETCKVCIAAAAARFVGDSDFGWRTGHMRMNNMTNDHTDYYFICWTHSHVRFVPLPGLLNTYIKHNIDTHVKFTLQPIYKTITFYLCIYRFCL